MSQWYLSKNGQALGPLEEDKVVALIREGELSPVDLVYEMGATEWIPISEVEVFAQHFKKEPEVEPANADGGEKEWVILKKVVTEKGKEYKQIGPFSVSQVFQMIDQGEAKFTDFAWKQGMDTWVKISEISEFDSPLPSSPPVDTSIYEKTNVDIETADTVVDKDQKASLTELVNIEHFKHEKTMVQPSQSSPIREPRRAVKQKVAEEDTEVLSSAESSLFAEISEVTPIPINEESFVTESDITNPGESESDISLWSLEPPNSQSGKSTEEDATQVASSKDKKKPKAKDKKKKPKPKPKPKPKRTGEAAAFSFEKLNTETMQWLGVISFVLVAVFLFYQSLNVSTDPIQYDPVPFIDSEQGAVEESSARPYQSEEIDQKMAGYQETLKSARNEKPAPAEIEGSKLPKEVVDKIAPPPPGPKVPIAEKTNPEAEQKVLPTPPPKKMVQVEEAKPTAKPEPKKVVKKAETKKTDRKVAGKKKVIKDRAKIMQKTKKKVTPKPVKPAQKKAPARSASAGVATPPGGRKSQSYYKQRDRMALFYSSLKAETLAVEIASQFDKLKDSRTAWGRYYGQWRKKVQASLARDIREFPKRNEMYAYPKVLAEFKKDYNLFYKYGESFDSKVKGTRTPSGVPSNMRQIFTQYKKQAQSLGR